MQNEFDRIIDRQNTGSWKWDEFGPDVLPMWIADMDFSAPNCVKQALHEAVEHGVFGYSHVTEELTNLLIDRLKTRHNISAVADDLVYLPGLVTGINLACKCAGNTGDEVLVPSPAYPPFLIAPANQQRKCVKVPILKNNSSWELDFQALENKISKATKLILLCNPHNPTGRVYTKAELLKIGEIACKHDLIICSDEIHCDLVLDETARHISIASLSDEIADRTITMLAPSKTFNIAGLGFSFAVITNPALRNKFKPTDDGLVPHINQLGFVAAEAAYKLGEPWRLELIKYLRENLEVVKNELAEIPELDVTIPQATYLTWIDCTKLGLRDPSRYFLEEGIGLGFGSFFGNRQFVRINFACPRKTLHKGLEIIKRACKKLKQ